MALHQGGSMPHAQGTLTKRKVWFLAPQLVGYARLCLLCIGLAATPRLPLLSYLAFLTNFVLDGVDGYLARKLNQTTRLGALLDVGIDILSRAAVWAVSVDGPWNVFPVLLECLVFVCTHTVSSGAWKTDYFADAPAWVSAVMRNGFKSPLGCLAIGGLMGLPLWLYAHRFLPATLFASLTLGLLLLCGRLLCAAVECWVIYSHLNALAGEDVSFRTKPA